MFLALVLMLNGIASAMAAVQYAAGPALPAATSEAPLVDPAAGGAHDACAELEPRLVENDAPITGNTHDTGHHPGADCCESGACQCACAYSGSPALPPDARNGFGDLGQMGVRPTASWHAAPALPHLMRPPIS